MATQNGNNRGPRVPTRSDSTIPSETGVPAPPRGKATKPAAKTVTGPTRSSAPTHVQPRRAERRPEMIRQQREDRRKAYEKQRRQWLLTRIGLAAFGVLVIGGIGFWIFSSVRDQQLNQVPDGTQEFAYAGGDHIQPDEPQTVQYAESPPVGGKHDAAWQNCGYYDAPIRNENVVHSLEHGAVWITYRPDLPQNQIDELRRLANDQTYILVSPFENLQAPVVASSWNHQIALEGADDDRLDQFIRRFRNNPETTPEQGAACTGGVGTPL